MAPAPPDDAARSERRRPDAVDASPSPASPAPARTPTPAAPPVDASAPVPRPGAETTPAAPLAPTASDPGGGDDLERLRHGWTTVVTSITARNRAVKPLITACRPIGVEGNVVTLGFPEEQGFLKDVADRRRPLLEECIGGYLGHDVGRALHRHQPRPRPAAPGRRGGGATSSTEAHRIFADDRLDVPEVS